MAKSGHALKIDEDRGLGLTALIIEDELRVADNWDPVPVVLDLN
jgi:hypothetical protein